MNKLLGVILCITATTLYGMSMGENIRKRYNSLNEIMNMIVLLRAEIEYRQVGISEAFLCVSLKTKGNIRSFLNRLREKTMDNEGVFEDMWKEEVLNCFLDMKLSEKDMEEILNLGKNIGYLGMNMQVMNFSLYIDRTSEELKKIRESMDKTIKLYRTLGIMAGIAISIILI